MLEGANSKLSGTVSDINGKSACCILESLASGEASDSVKYDDLTQSRFLLHSKLIRKK
jgi:hypothetical protein